MSNPIADALYDRNVEEWREIPGFPGNEASTYGNLRTYWYRVRNKKGRGFHRERWDKPRNLPASPKDDGWFHTNIFCEPEGKRFTRNIQVLIAKTFLPRPADFDKVDYTVDHIKPGLKGKRDNSVWNLQWLSRADNIRKAYRDWVCDERIRRSQKPIIATDEWTGESAYFSSIKEAGEELGLDRTNISHALTGQKRSNLVGERYSFEYAGREERLLFGDEDDKLLSWLRIGVR